MSSLTYTGFQNAAVECRKYLAQINYADKHILDSLDFFITNKGIFEINMLEASEKFISSLQKVLPDELYSALYNNFYIFFKEVYFNYRIIATLDGLLAHPTKFVEHADSYFIKTYLEGFVNGIGTAYFKNTMQLVNNWYKKQIDNDISVYWTDYIMGSGYSEGEKIELMIKVVKSFIEENPSWFSQT